MQRPEQAPIVAQVDLVSPCVCVSPQGSPYSIVLPWGPRPMLFLVLSAPLHHLLRRLVALVISAVFWHDPRRAAFLRRDAGQARD
eukprot:SAG11_NODE_16318_length_550_cov_29.784922_2_plen_84_part_01